MTKHRVTTLHLQLNLDADPIAGLISAGAGEGTPFSGWIELARTIELSLDQARRALPPVPGDVKRGCASACSTSWTA
jgi:hypothetical protein